MEMTESEEAGWLESEGPNQSRLIHPNHHLPPPHTCLEALSMALAKVMSLRALTTGSSPSSAILKKPSPSGERMPVAAT